MKIRKPTPAGAVLAGVVLVSRSGSFPPHSPARATDRAAEVPAHQVALKWSPTRAHPEFPLGHRHVQRVDDRDEWPPCQRAEATRTACWS